MNNISIRPFLDDDMPFLTKMLYEALYVPDGEAPFLPEILHQPQIRKYVEGFGSRTGDIGLIAEADGMPVGAAWCRLLHGYGYVDDKTPELSVAVAPGWRRAGIGTSLVEALCLQLAEAGFRRLSLSCDSRNPAIRLYRRLGFLTIRIDEGVSHIMLKPLF